MVAKQTMTHRTRTRRLGMVGLAVIALTCFAAAGVIPSVELTLTLAERMLLWLLTLGSAGFIYWGLEEKYRHLGVRKRGG